MRREFEKTPALVLGDGLWKSYDFWKQRGSLIHRHVGFSAPTGMDFPRGITLRLNASTEGLVRGQ